LQLSHCPNINPKVAKEPVSATRQNIEINIEKQNFLLLEVVGQGVEVCFSIKVAKLQLVLLQDQKNL
jgi:hypothetical protein